MADLETIKTDATNAVETVLKQARSQHFTLLAFFAIVSLVLAGSMYFGVKSYETALTKADAQYAALQKKDEADTAVLKEHTETRQAQTRQIAIADKVTADRNAKAEVLKAKIVVANATDAEVQANSEKILGDPGVLYQGEFVFKKATVQQFMATKVDADTLKQDNVDLVQKVVVLTDMVKTTQTDLATCVTDKAETKDALLTYRKAAKKSKWKKALDVTEKVGLFAAGVAVTYVVVK